jgi:hypothetical protein
MWPILADAGSSFSSKAQATVRAPPEDNGRDDPGFPTVSLSTKEVSVCRARCGRILRPKLIYKEVYMPYATVGEENSGGIELLYT